MLLKLKKPGTTISGFILLILVVVLIITIINGYFITESLKSAVNNDAFIVNKLGQIRGLTQRYTKLKLLNIPTESVSQQIENDFNIVKKISSTYLPASKKERFLDLFNEVITEWKDIKNSNNKEMLLIASEKCWQLSNDLTSYAAQISEYKSNKLMKNISIITLVTAILILTMILIVYFLIKKGLEKEKVIDPLTKLFNRRHFIDIFNYFVDIYNRYNRPFSMIFLDIDNFKKINDTYGHQKGDDVLVSLSKHIISSLRNTDTAFRYGGEEIVIIMPETELYEAFQIAERLRQSIKEKIKVDNKPVTVSIGVGTYNGEGVFSFIERIDEAVYEAKRTGKDKVIVSR